MNKVELIESVLKRFLKNVRNESLTTKEFPKMYDENIEIAVSFGQGNLTYIPWISFLGPNQKTMDGIYPVILYYKDRHLLILSYGVSATNTPKLKWTNLGDDVQTIGEYVSKQHLSLRHAEHKYDSSYVYSIYDVRNHRMSETELDQLATDVMNLIEEYKLVLKGEVNTKDNVIENNSDKDDENIEYGVKDRDYRMIVTAIKTKPFVLLAGISGTGKSRIVRQLAKGCWEEGSVQSRAQKPENFEMIQVKPNWHDSSELIGYVSRINGEKYIVGDFLRFVARAWKHLDMPYFLCLDEMNLAPVEQYFAEYLSVIESRKLRNGDVVTDAIVKAPTDKQYELGKIYRDDWYWCLIQELFGDNQELFESILRNGLTLPQNLIVVGTVNMDETTFSFSRKVLDRAMTIEMNKVDLCAGLDDFEDDLLYYFVSDDFIGLKVEGKDVYHDNQDVCDKVLGYLLLVNEVLENTPFKIAYRTRNEFLIYVVNSLNMMINDLHVDESLSLILALDEMTSMKILSRIEGERNQVEGVLEHLKNVITDCFNKIIKKDISSIEDVEWISLKKIDEMLEKMSYTGYTSFWK